MFEVTSQYLAFAFASIFIGLVFWFSGKQANARQSRRGMSLLLDNMPFGVAVFDASRKLLLCNSKYAEVYSLPPHLAKPGATQHDILNYRISHGIHAGTDAQKYVQDRVAIASQNRARTTILELSNGRILSVCHCPLTSGGWLSTHEDVTERTALERKTTVLSEEAARRAHLDGAIQAFRQSVDAAMALLCGSASEMKSASKELSGWSADVLTSVDSASSEVDSASVGVDLALNSANELQAAIREIERQLALAANVVSGGVREAEKAKENIAGFSNQSKHW